VHDYPIERVPLAVLLQVSLLQSFLAARAFILTSWRCRELGTIELQVKNEKNTDSVPQTYRQEQQLRIAIQFAAKDKFCIQLTQCAGDSSLKAQSGW
jgi:hypothetical protein